MLSLPPEQQSQIKKGQNIARTAWIAFLSTPVLMLVIVHFALHPSPIPDLEENSSNSFLFSGLLPIVFTVESLLLIGVSLWTRTRLLQRRISRGKPSTQELVQGWVVSIILSFALAEAIAINGVILYILGATLPLAACFAGTAFLLLLFEAPKEREIPKLLEQIRLLHPGVRN